MKEKPKHVIGHPVKQYAHKCRDHQTRYSYAVLGLAVKAAGSRNHKQTCYF